MLSILFGKETENTNIDPDTYFNNTCEIEWFDDEIVKQIIRDIDDSEVLGFSLISKHLGAASVEWLSGGCKTLILLYKDDDFEPDLIWLGNNCEDWLIKIANIKDIKAVMTGEDLHFSGKQNLIFLCLNDNSIIKDFREWNRKLIDYVALGD